MNISFGMNHQQPPSSSSSSSMHAAASFISTKEASAAYDIGELDQSWFMYVDGQQGGHSAAMMTTTTHQEHIQTLNIFPSQPMHHVEPSPKGEISLVLSPTPGGSTSKKSPDQQAMEALGSQRLHDHLQHQPLIAEAAGKDVKPVAKKEHKKGTSTSERDPKTLRRLAQNREAARKSRLRKKAYIQQLESGRIKLAQLEQELQRARAQGMFFGGGVGGGACFLGEQGVSLGIDGLSSDAAVFDVEYERWWEEHQRRMCEVRAALQQHLPEGELQVLVEGGLAHHDELVRKKSGVMKGDVFHLISGMWRTPAERCFLWLGGFRPSEVIKILLSHIEPLTEQQMLAVYELQKSAQETEEALTQGLDALYQSLSDTIASDALTYPSDMADYFMTLAMNKLTTLEGFAQQAEYLRQQTLHRLHQILTTRQMARSLVAIFDYFHRLRTLSSLWTARRRPEQ